MGPKKKLGIICWVMVCLILRSSWGSGLCGLEVQQQNKVYRFSLTSPLKNYPHGVLSEDGFYKISNNDSGSDSETEIWFQLCEQMIFNHDPPRCSRCEMCGGPLHCGVACSALMATNIDGYYICTTLGHAANMDVSLIDTKSPEKGVRLSMSASSTAGDCSLSVSVYCNTHGLKAPTLVSKSGSCNYMTTMMHPTGCPVVTNRGNKGFGWLGSLAIVLLCIFATYLLTGVVYRFFVLGIRGTEVIPNKEFWLSVPSRIQHGRLAFLLHDIPPKMIMAWSIHYRVWGVHSIELDMVPILEFDGSHMVSHSLVVLPFLFGQVGFEFF